MDHEGSGVETRIKHLDRLVSINNAASHHCSMHGLCSHFVMGFFNHAHSMEKLVR